MPVEALLLDANAFLCDTHCHISKFCVSEVRSLRRRGILKSSRADMPDACVSCSFYYVTNIENGTILRKIDTLAETCKMEGKLATRVRKSVLILAAKYNYKVYNLFFARLVSRICSIYVWIFCTHCSSISHIIRN